MKFSKIKKLILFGGSKILSEFVKDIAKRADTKIIVFSSLRHLEEIIVPDQISFSKILQKNGVGYFDCDDINKCKNLKAEIISDTLGIAFGASWVFSKKTVGLFAKNHLLDFMPIDLPRYRGGAHYTWQILHQDRVGAVNLQIIEGDVDSFQRGKIVKRKEFKMSVSLEKPLDYFDFIIGQEIAFLREFLSEVKSRKNFLLKSLDEEESSYYPFLNTYTNGLVNWSWSGRDLYLFINAFDDPYAGASTYLRGKKVFLKDCHVANAQDKYHPFTSGIIVRKNASGIFVAAAGSLLNIKKVSDGRGKNLMEIIELGDRFYTPSGELEGALTFRAEYDWRGLKRQRRKG